MLAYRPDIDGLRAIAVLSVVIYHLNSTLLPGGFVGVDIFFVISGYLITKLIYKELVETNTFSFKNFYVRRIRRLFPALFATITFSLIATYIWFSPAHLIEFAYSSVSAIFSFSNIYFWHIADYFDTQSELKPLLHTWSLSVEEQFYLIWPLLMLGLYLLGKKKLIPIAILILAALSLALNLVFFSEQSALTNWFEKNTDIENFSVQSTAFYWLPFRVFELAIGAILIWMPKLSEKPKFILNEVLFIVGLLLIVYACFAFSHTTEFPSKAALIPCVGAALLIYSGANTHKLSWLTNNRVMVFIGLISYSFYLIHWPLIVFFKYQNFEMLSYLDQFGLFVASILIAYVMYRWIEQPFRKPNLKKAAPHKRFLIASAAAVATMVGVSVHATSSGGWLHRYPSEVIAQLSYQKGDYTEYFWKNIKQLEGGFANNNKPRVLIIGDSMAADLVNVLIEGEANQDLDIATISLDNICKAIFPLTEERSKQIFAGAHEKCQAQLNKVVKNPALLQQADTIVLASYWWENWYVDSIPNSVDYLNKNYLAKVMVLGVKDQVSNGIWFLNKHALAPNTHKIRTPLAPKAENINHMLKSQAQNKYDYFDLNSHFCNENGCQRVTKKGYVIIFDQSHFSPNGTKFVSRNIKESDWYQSLLDSKLDL